MIHSLLPKGIEHSSTDQKWAIKSRRVRVLVEGGIVTLAGRMRNLLDEDIAVGLTRQVRGVVSVIDQLEVNRTDRHDATLLKDVQAALTSDPGMRDLQVFVAVKPRKFCTGAYHYCCQTPAGTPLRLVRPA